MTLRCLSRERALLRTLSDRGPGLCARFYLLTPFVSSALSRTPGSSASKGSRGATAGGWTQRDATMVNTYTTRGRMDNAGRIAGVDGRRNR